jgi:hypothetical protein
MLLLHRKGKTHSRHHFTPLNKLQQNENNEKNDKRMTNMYKNQMFSNTIILNNNC